MALGHLGGFARWLGLDPTRLGDREPSPGGQAYTAWVAWLALNGSAADVALAFLANLAAWGDNCARVSAALRQRYDAGAEATAFFDFVAAPAPGFQEGALTCSARYPNGGRRLMGRGGRGARRRHPWHGRTACLGQGAHLRA